MKLLVALFVVSIIFQVAISLDCPTPVQLWRELSKCNRLRNIRRSESYLNGLVYDTTCGTEKVVQRCFGIIKAACAQGTRNSVTRYMMSKLVDIAVITRANAYFCNNKNVLVTGSLCLRNQTISTPMRLCMKVVDDQYDLEFSQSGISLAPQTIEQVDTLLPAMCRFSNGMMNCYEQNIEGVCNDNAVAVLLNLAFASTIPGCRE